MTDDRKYYVLCGSNCKFESMTKEQILTAIEQAISTGAIQNVDTGFVTTLKEQNAQAGVKFWIGTSAEYNALATKLENCFYILTDDTTEADIHATLEEHAAGLKSHAETLTVLKREYDKKNVILLDLGDRDLKDQTIKNILNYSLVAVEIVANDEHIKIPCFVSSNDDGSILINGFSSRNRTLTSTNLELIANYSVKIKCDGSGKVTEWDYTNWVIQQTNSGNNIPTVNAIDCAFTKIKGIM